MIDYDNMKNYVSAGLTTLGYTKLPAFSEGPASDGQVQKISPQSIVFLTVGGGATDSTEGLFNQPFVSVRCAGPQGNPAQARQLMQDVDRILTSISGNTDVDGVLVLRCSRSGGLPILIMLDNANRSHWTCSYIVEAAADFMPIGGGGTTGGDTGDDGEFDLPTDEYGNYVIDGGPAAESDDAFILDGGAAESVSA